MGTDIHLYVEGKDRWSEEKPERWRMLIHEDAAYGARNYNVFAVLANVRNGYGFAGIDTGDGFKVIAEPRGLPEDISDGVLEEAEDHGGHDESWLLLSEVLDFDWTQTTKHRGWVNGTEVLRMLLADEKEPYTYCGGVSGRDIQHVSRSQILERINSLGPPPKKVKQWLLANKERSFVTPNELEPEVWKFLEPLTQVYTQLEWPNTYEESCASFLKWARGLVDWRNNPAGMRYAPNELRFVFWFDS